MYGNTGREKKRIFSRFNIKPIKIMNNILDFSATINAVDYSENLLIKGTCRTGKTSLAILLARKLLETEIPVTIINSTYTIGKINTDYEQTFIDFNADYWHQMDGQATATNSLLFGVGLWHGNLSANLPASEVISCLKARLGFFKESVIVLDEIHHIHPDIRNFLDQVLINRLKYGISNIYISQDANYIDPANFKQEILCSRPLGNFCLIKHNLSITEERIELIAYEYAVDLLVGHSSRDASTEYDRRFYGAIREVFESRSFKYEQVIESVKASLTEMLATGIKDSRKLTDTYLLQKDLAIVNKIDLMIQSRKNGESTSLFTVLDKIATNMLEESCG
jgi:hypothetical protein